MHVTKSFAMRALFDRKKACALILTTINLSALAQSVTITSPANKDTLNSAVNIVASVSGWSNYSHMEVYDNGEKLGDGLQSSIDTV